MSHAPFYRCDPSLHEKEGVRHAFFDRSAAANNAEPQETARQTLAVARAISVKQVHSARAFVVRQAVDLGESAQSPREADALVSSVPNLLLCVYTADCAPVLLFDDEARVCAALHAGWRGALKGIVQETVRSMRTLGAQEKRTLAVIGPTIGVASYPVGEEFREAFLQQSAENKKFFVQESQQWHFDLPAYVENCLSACGVGNVRRLGLDSDSDLDLDIDTFSDRKFFSHRRSLQEGAQERGRNLSAIALV